MTAASSNRLAFIGFFFDSLSDHVFYSSIGRSWHSILFVCLGWTMVSSPYSPFWFSSACSGERLSRLEVGFWYRRFVIICVAIGVRLPCCQHPVHVDHRHHVSLFEDTSCYVESISSHALPKARSIFSIILAQAALQTDLNAIACNLEAHLFV